MRSIPSRYVVLISILVLLVSCAKGKKEIRIGEYGSLTGTTATFGQSTKDGIQLAIDEANAAAGIAGATITVLVEDDQGKPEEAATAVNKLINQDRVIALLGEVASSRSLAAAPIAQNAGIPMITPSSTNPEVTQKGDFIFRVCYLDSFQGEATARFSVNSLQAKKAAILRDIRNDYSIGLAEFFVKTFESLGGTIVANESYGEGDIEFKAQLTSIKTKQPDVIFVPGYYTEVGLIARQARDLGITVPLVGGDGWDSPRLVEIGGTALEGCYFSNHYSVSDQSPAVQKFVNDFRAKYNQVPDALAALAYDAAKVLLRALQETATSDPDGFRTLLADSKDDAGRKAALVKVRDAIAATKDFPGVTGTISLNAERNAVKPLVILTIKNGAYEYVGTVQP